MQELEFPFETNCGSLDLYEKLFFNDHSLIFESRDPLSKQNRQSLIGINAALKAVQKGLDLKLEALNNNGRCLIDLTLRRFGGELSPDGNLLKLSYKKHHEIFNEEKRLKASHPVEVISFLQNTLKSLPKLFIAGTIGFDYINTYETIKGFENLEDDGSCDLILIFFDLSLCIDHLQNSKYLLVDDFSPDNRFLGSLVTTASNLIAGIKECNFKSPALKDRNPGIDDLKSLGLAVDCDDESFSSKISALKENIKDGDIFQVVPARTFTMPCKNPLLAYRYLSAKNPSPYMFYINCPDLTLFGTSPEFALRYEADGRRLYISPIAGTRPRALNPDGSIDEAVDARIELELRTNQKELSEHIMLVDLARNDLSRISNPGTVKVSKLLYIVKYQHVMHLVSDVAGILQDDLDGLRAYLSVMNMGTLSGAPKLKAHELIYQAEGKRRNFYGGTMVRLGTDGSLDSCIVIRSALVKNDRAEVQAGCGITQFSIEKEECAETLFKARSVLSAVYNAEKDLQLKD